MRKILTKYSTAIIHCICWLIFITYEILFITTLTGKPLGFSDYFFPYAINISLFYFHAHFVMELKRGKKGRIGFLVFWLVLEIVLYLLVIHIAGNLAQAARGIKINPLSIEKFEVLRSVWRGIYFILLGSAYWFAKKSIAQNNKISAMEYERLENLIEKKELEKNLIRSDNAYLRSQVNPHLLFNTLNFIYGAIFEVSEQAAQSVILLSEIMRYSLTEANEDGKVPLSHEITHIKNFISINELRLKGPFAIQTFFQEDETNTRIIPLILMTLVENLFIHADLTAGNADDSYLYITCRDNELTYLSKNRKKQFSTIGHGLGIPNIMERLKTHYLDKFVLELENTSDFYSVKLEISL
jgi:two-component system LytT family sensor kinase